jgi:peptidoglycan/LPS O-acetylase OafA/YrhL
MAFFRALIIGARRMIDEQPPSNIRASARTMTSSNEEHKKFYALDAMRGLAALAVLCTHSVSLMGPFAPQHGYLAVDLFFGMSGFVIAYAYDARLASGMTAARFILIRLIRLYPLFLLGLVLSAIVMGLGQTIHVGSTAWPSKGILRSAILTGFFLPTPITISDKMVLFPLNSAYWSLMFELVINALYAALFRFISIKVVTFILILSVFGLAAEVFFMGNLNGGPAYDNFLGGMPRVAFAFFLGVLIRRTNLQLPLRATPFLILVMPVIFFLPIGRLGGAYDLVCAVFVFPFLLVAGTSWAPRGRAMKLSMFLGTTSYAIYVTHIPLILIFSGSLHALRVDTVALAPLFAVPAVFGVLWFAALVVACYDIPARRYLMYRLIARDPVLDKHLFTD